MKELRFEICIDSVVGAIRARQAGAHRVELCAALSVGGITPSAAMIRHVRAECDLGLHVLIRPRGGGFHYDAGEWSVMEADIALAGEWGAEGVVIGGLREDGSVDTDRCARLIECARPMSVTFHRAFDVSPDPEAALDDLIGLGVDRVLTSGQAASAYAGRDLLGRLVERAAGQLIVMAGAGVSEENVHDLMHASGVHELHFSARRPLASSPGATASGGVQMGSDAAADRTRDETDVARIRAIIAAARGASG